MTEKVIKPVSKSMTSIERGTAIISLGGKQRSAVTEVFNLSMKINTKYPDLPKPISKIRVVKIDNLVYCIGDGNTENAFLIDLNKKDMKWTEVASMNKSKSWHAAAVFKNNIVVSDAASAEMYEIDTNKWTILQNLNIMRNGHALVVCNDCLFAIGGFSKKSVEKLSDLQEKWEKVQPMNVKRNRVAAVCLNDTIYAIGGNSQGDTQKGSEKSVEKFVPKDNKWSFVSDMNTARWDHSACVMGSKIYVVGGKDEDGNFVKTIECYDPANDTWIIVTENIPDLVNHEVIVV